MVAFQIFLIHCFNTMVAVGKIMDSQITLIHHRLVYLADPADCKTGFHEPAQNGTIEVNIWINMAVIDLLHLMEGKILALEIDLLNTHAVYFLGHLFHSRIIALFGGTLNISSHLPKPARYMNNRHLLGVWPVTRSKPHIAI